MKTKEIIAQLDIQRGVSSKKQPQFFEAMVREISERYAKMNGNDDARKFDVVVKEVKGVWDSISLKIDRMIPEGQWRYFFATQVIELKTKLCPTWAQRKQQEHEEFLKRQELREQRKKARSNHYDGE